MHSPPLGNWPNPFDERRDDQLPGAGSDTASPKPTESSSESALLDSNFVTVCSWCPELHILKLQRRDRDIVAIHLVGKQVYIHRNGVPLAISHGMCDACKTKQLATVAQSSAGDSVPPGSAENAAETGAGQTKETKQTPAPAARLVPYCAEHRLELKDGHCDECRDADGNTFVLDMQSIYLDAPGLQGKWGT